MPQRASADMAASASAREIEDAQPQCHLSCTGSPSPRMAATMSVTQASGPRLSNSRLMRSRVTSVTRGSELNG